MQETDRLAALKRVAILEQLPAPRLSHLAATCRWRSYNAGQQIVNYQERSTDVFFLTAGKVRVVVYSAEGKAVLFTDLGPGAMFGEIAAIDKAARSAGIEALNMSTVASLTADQFDSLLLNEPVLALAVLRHVAAELRRLSERVLEFSTLMVQNRIHAELLRLAADVGRREGRVVVLSPAPSLSDIANRISTHREAVSRELSRLASIGLLRRDGGDLCMPNVERLERLVREAKGE
jgi:CRP/FNR family cyclic AMP-dependent transcriptional regulator